MLNKREYRQIQMLQPALTKRIESDYYVEGFATTFNKPYELYEYDGVKYYETIDRHALDSADMSDVIMQYDHTGKVMARQSNKSLILEANDVGLFVCADLRNSVASKELYQEIATGLVTRMSWAFIVQEEAYNRETRTRTILKVKKVYDVSAVSIPANNDTEISARTYIDGVIEVEKRESQEQEKKLNLAKAKILIL